MREGGVGMGTCGQNYSIQLAINAFKTSEIA